MKIIRKSTLIILAVGTIISTLAACGEVKTISEKETNSVPKDAEAVPAIICDVYGDADAIVTVISDDGFYESGVNIDRIFGERNLKCTVAGAIYIVEPHKDEWEELLTHGTIDLVSHSYNHIRMEDGRPIAEDVDALIHEIVDADRWYEDWLGTEQIVFVCPENQMCEMGYKLLEGNDFWAVRKGHRGYNPLSPEDGTEHGQWLSLMVQGICDEGTDTQVRNEWIDTAISDGVWLIEMWHNVMPEDDGGYQTLLESEAEEHLDYVAEKASENRIWVATFDEAVKYIRERQNSNINAYLDGDTLCVSVSLTNGDMSAETFNQALTVSVELPDGYIMNENDDAEIENNILTMNVIPGETKTVKLNRKQDGNGRKS